MIVAEFFMSPPFSKKLSSVAGEAKSRLTLIAKTLRNGKLNSRVLFALNPAVRVRRVLASEVHPQTLPLKPDLVRGWKPYPLFNGATTETETFSCHTSVLVKGHIPHPPHRHREEEILIMLSGEGDVILPEVSGPNGDHVIRLKPGQFVYYPAGFPHTLQAVSEAPANYLMFKWYARPKSLDSMLSFGQFDMMESFRGEVKSGFITRKLFEGPTGCLKKLHCHTSILTPGAGYSPHADPYDVALIILEGEVETLDRRAHPHDVIFYAAGAPHGIRNPGTVPAKYLVFEFHGRS